MLRQFLKQVNNDTTISSLVTNGEATFKSVHEEVEMEIFLQDGYAPNGAKNLNEFIFTKQNAVSMDDNKQIITLPSGSNNGSLEIAWNKWINYGCIELFNDAQTVIANNRKNNKIINYDTLTFFGPTTNVASKYGDSVLLPNGKLLLLPYNESSMAIVDPITQTVTSFGPSNSDPYKYFSGVLLPDGKVFAIGLNGATVIVDPIALTVTPISFSLYVSDWQFRGSILLPNGQILLIPHNGANLFIIDLIAQTATKFGNALSGTGKYIGGVLLANEKVIAIDFNIGHMLMIDPINKTLTPFGDISNTQAYYGGILLDQNHILKLNYNTSYPRLVNFTNQIETDILPLTLTPKHQSGVLLPDGRCLAFPRLTDSLSFIDPLALTLEMKTFTNNTGKMYITGRVLPDGRIFLAPSNAAASCAILSASDGDYGETFSLNTCLSAYFNKL